MTTPAADLFADYVDQVIADAPPLSAEQVETLRGLLGPAITRSQGERATARQRTARSSRRAAA